MLKKIKEDTINLIKYEFKYLMIVFLIVIICFIPMNYYIVIGGGISDIKSRVKVDNGYEAKGSFNISYVSEVEGSLLTYALSYIIPTWDKIETSNYTYSEEESIEDINFRSELSLKSANQDAKYVAYTKAGKKIEKISTKYFVLTKNYDYEECNLKVGDQILELDNHEIDNFDYKEYINSLNEGDYVNVKIIRNGKEKDIKTRIYASEDRLLIGIYLKVLNEYKETPSAEIKFKKNESGPSGGLMTTLSIYNQLVEEDITKGLVIAGTGTIDSEGNVGEIGGVEYKVLGAAKGGADIFLVPDGNNYKEAIKIVKKKKLKIKVIPVSTFDDALNYLTKTSA